MKKIAVSGLFVVVFIAYIFYMQTNKSETMAEAPVQSQNSTSERASSNLNLKDGEYTSSVGDAFFGPLQIKIIVAQGKIDDVEFLKHPDDRPTSIQINEEAMPILKQEAITAQSAEIDNVTGATQTADAFKLLMKEVLQQAKA
jgi:uncharacterized protein with FMN-binding domain